MLVIQVSFHVATPLSFASAGRLPLSIHLLHHALHLIAVHHHPAHLLPHSLSMAS